MLEWQKKKHLGLEKNREYKFGELTDWYLSLPKTEPDKVDLQDQAALPETQRDFWQYES